MNPYLRRDLLSSISVAIITVCAGCSIRENTGSSTNSTDTCSSSRSTADCTSIDLPEPEEPTSGGVKPTSYPEFPNDLSAETSGTYAASFEKALRRNRFVDDAGHRETPSLSIRVGTDTAQTLDCGFAVPVSGMLRTSGTISEVTTSSDTPTPIPSLEIEFATWYLVSEDIVKRVNAGDSFGTPKKPPSFNDAAAVYCP